MSESGSQQQHSSHRTAEKEWEMWQENKQYFQAIWENSPDAMALSAPDGTVIAANPAYFALYGYFPEDVIGKNYAIIFPKEQRAWAQELYNYIFQSPTISPAFEALVLRPDGTERVVESSYSFLTENGTRTAMLSIIRDITARKRTEEALRDSELKLHLALEIAHLGTWSWDFASDTLRLSANLEAMLGFAPGTDSATYTSLLELVHPQDRSVVDQEIRRAIEEGSDYEGEFRVIAPDGTIIRTKMCGQLLSDDAGKPTRMLGITMDITHPSERS